MDQAWATNEGDDVIEVGFLVLGDYCHRCGDTNYDPQTRECQTCADPEHPCSRAYLEPELWDRANAERTIEGELAQ
jgi:ribosomal protein L37E